jgi:hypothetical protein
MSTGPSWRHPRLVTGPLREQINSKTRLGPVTVGADLYESSLLGSWSHFTQMVSEKEIIFASVWMGGVGILKLGIAK